MPIRASREEKLHAERWREAHNWEMALVLAFQQAGYSRDESRRMAEAHRRGELLTSGHNGGPPLD